MEKIPNAKVWILGREYLEAAESLVKEMKLWPAAVLAALSIEIFLKSFLAQEDKHGYPSTQRGHPLTDLFSKIDVADQAEIIRFSSQIDSTYDVRASLAKFNDNGSIVVTASSSVYEGAAATSLYAASKGALLAAARSWASAVAHRGIRVNTLVPGPIATNFRSFLPDEAREGFESFVVNQVPLQRVGTSEEAAAVALFLLSNASSYVTGSQYAVDGGLIMQ